MKKVKADIARYLQQYGRIQAVLRYVNSYTLKLAYKKLLERGAGKIGFEYGENLDRNLNQLLKRMKNMTFFPKSQKRYLTPNNSTQKNEYDFRVFEEEIVQWVFEEILNAIFKFKIKEILPRNKSQQVNENPRRLLIAIGWLTISTQSIQENIEIESFLSFLKQYIDDRKFIEYVRRFMDKNDQINLYMLNSAYIYYILKNIIGIDDCYLTGNMWIKKDAEGLQLMFTSLKDARVAYLCILKRLKRLEFDAEIPICTLSFLSDRTKYHKPVLKNRC